MSVKCCENGKINTQKFAAIDIKSLNRYLGPSTTQCYRYVHNHVIMKHVLKILGCILMQFFFKLHVKDFRVNVLKKVVEHRFALKTDESR